MQPATERALEAYWTDQLGVSGDAFETGGVVVGEVGDDAGVQVFVRDGTVAVGAPSAFVADCRARADALAAVAADDPAALERWVEERVAPVETVLGPAFYGYTDRERFEPVASAARVLTDDDEAAYDRFRAAVPADEWDAGGPAFEPGETVGIEADGRLVAAAGFKVWDEQIAHVGVVTHPDYRSRGFGRAVVSRATERALDAGLWPQYRTLDAWPWSVALAEGLGFERFATGLLVVVAQPSNR
ncbi:GNAT family N-acetyltransferase [Haloarchaeobius litoreus]|uniref:GNAT family N-acetyltransferase n=1 Tax=Haloarchaeobius litoreus TaxID=755306 RepID=A0ABD6DLY8_9EURY|nr:GNAT family N-acetyltransferase [Haloarchaeobius litoreus]